ncbi:MAG TPA: phospho-N-acetylmuramoyl-pentapeptide-transferase [Candidatus Megamonas gallistercoris]|nr:phospho-N-acetylmuramoyl-pentapeptide-transferase [Candidatus Megamonas gallistercoris]
MMEIFNLNMFWAALAAALVVLVTGPFLIPELHKLKFGQSIREEGPKSHQAKSGTPTMGGIMIIAGITIATLIFADWSIEIGLALFVMLGHFVLGFLDDYIKVVLKRNLGLKAKQKFLGQLIIALIVTYIGINYTGLTQDVWIPFLGKSYDIGWFYYVLVIGVLVGTTNAVNLTDGLDGLAAGSMAVASLGFVAVCLYFGKTNLAIFSFASFGACAAFLKFNYHPAKVFMGDTGSLALGGVLAALGILTKTELLLIILGGLFVIETLSVIIQVTSFKTTGKRVFLMSPIHHHFELKGWSETHVVWSFWTAELIFCILAMLTLHLS